MEEEDIMDEDGEKIVEFVDEVPKPDFFPSKTVERSESTVLLLDPVASDCNDGINVHEKLRLSTSLTEERGSGSSSPERSSSSGSNRRRLGRILDFRKKKDREFKEVHVLGGGCHDHHHHPPPPPPPPRHHHHHHHHHNGEEEEGELKIDGKEKRKKKSSWMPDPEKRWPIQGFY